MGKALFYSDGREDIIDMKPLGILISVFSLGVGIALAVYGVAVGSWIAFLSSAVCLLVVGYMWFMQKDLNKKISGRGKG